MYIWLHEAWFSWVCLVLFLSDFVYLTNLRTYEKCMRFSSIVLEFCKLHFIIGRTLGLSIRSLYIFCLKSILLNHCPKWEETHCPWFFSLRLLPLPWRDSGSEDVESQTHFTSVNIPDRQSNYNSITPTSNTLVCIGSCFSWSLDIIGKRLS